MRIAAITADVTNLMRTAQRSQRSRGGGSTVSCREPSISRPMDLPVGRRGDAAPVGSNHPPLYSNGTARRQARPSRRGPPCFAPISPRSSRAHEGASERAARSPETLNCAPGRLPAPGALSGPRVFRQHVSAVMVFFPRGARILSAFVGPLFLLKAHAVPGRFPSSRPELREEQRAAVSASSPPCDGKRRDRHASLLHSGRVPGRAQESRPTMPAPRQANPEKVHQTCNSGTACPEFPADASTGLRDVSRGGVLTGSARLRRAKKHG